MSGTRNKILLIGKHEKLLDLFSFSLQSEFNFEIISFSNILGVIEYFDSKNEVLMVIADYNIGDKLFSNILKTFSDSKLSIPFMGIGVPQKFQDKAENVELINEFISKDNAIEELVPAIKKYFTEDKSEPPEEYCAVKFSVLTVFENLEDDLFIKLPTGRFLKIFSEGDDVWDTDVERYAKKGVHYLYLNKLTYNWLLISLQKNIKEITRAIEEGEKPEITPSQEEKELAQRKLDNVVKIDDEMKKEVAAKVKKTMAQVKKVPALAKLLKKLMVKRDDQDYYKSHVTLLNQILIALCHALQWRQEATIEKLIFASYLHDITLINHPKLAKLQTKDELDALGDEVTEEERQLFLDHPNKIKEIVSKMPEAPIDADTIISQHHERPDGSGFPNGFPANRIHPQSALFIIAHDLVNYIIDDENWDINKFIEQSKTRYKGSNFTKITKVLHTIKF
jgi:hypothetical protein